MEQPKSACRSLKHWFGLCALLLPFGLAACRSAAPGPAAPWAQAAPGSISAVSAPDTAPPPAPFTVDRQTAAAIRHALAGDAAVAPAAEKVKVRVDKGVVTLRGTVPTAADRDAIVRRIGKLPGVDDINNQLEVK